jgi:hypothetical protein
MNLRSILRFSVVPSRRCRRESYHAFWQQHHDYHRIGDLDILAIDYCFGKSIVAASALSSINLDRPIGQTIFGSQFFGLSDEDSSLTISKDFWIFWVISMPVTVVVVGAWYAMKWRRFELVTKNKQIGKQRMRGENRWNLKWFSVIPDHWEI